MVQRRAGGCRWRWDWAAYEARNAELGGGLQRGRCAVVCHLAEARSAFYVRTRKACQFSPLQVIVALPNSVGGSPGLVNEVEHMDLRK